MTAQAADPLADDTPTRQPGEAPPEVKRDGYGRYLLPHPEHNGAISAFTRVTTFAKSVGDMFGIMSWEKRLVAKGIAMRPDLYAMASAHDISDKKTFDNIATQAKEAAGGSVKAQLGTALHQYVERLNRGEKLKGVPSPWDADIEAYQKRMAAAKIRPHSGFIETIVIIPKFGIAGTFDALLTRETWTLPRVGDLKTGDITYSKMEIAAQLYCYSQATHWYHIPTNTLYEMPKIDLQTGIIIHLPVGVGECEIFEIDLDFGGRVAAACSAVRNLRSRKGYVRVFTEGFDAIADAVSEEVTSSDAWDDEPVATTTTPETSPADSTTVEPPADDGWDDEPKAESAKIVERVLNGGGGEEESGTEPLADYKKRWEITPIGPSGSKRRYVLTDNDTKQTEEYRRKKDAIARKEELEDSLIAPGVKVRPVGVAADDWDDEPAQNDEPAQETAAADDGWDDEPAQNDEPAQETAAADDGWDDDEAVTTTAPAGVAPQADEWDADEAGQPPAPSNGEAGQPQPNLMMKIVKALSVDDLLKLYESAEPGEWTEGHTAAAKQRKVELLTEVASDDDDW